MEQTEFEVLVKALNEKNSVAEILEALSGCDDEEVAAAAQSLRGQFSLAEIEGVERIYHVFEQEDDNGEMQEYAEWVMNNGDPMMAFIAWFFYSQFEIKDKDTYAAAGIRLVQPKKLK
uniref:hypothetical protein n=1 Tax=Thaumasiovibrio occultus TaxID=1891184 RepID=UPI000B3590F4|nr:hypothetical protein [Thaumasiovibrio occultus]